MNDILINESNLRSIAFSAEKYTAQFILNNDGSIILYFNGILLRKCIIGPTSKILEFDTHDLFHGFFSSSIIHNKSTLSADLLTELKNAIKQFLDFLKKEMEGEEV